MSPNLKIGVVGACGTGKSEIVSRLKAQGYKARHIAQEHSFAPNMWHRISKPDILVYLQVSYDQTLIRKNFHWTEKEYQEQLHRLRNAKENADIEINTDPLTLDEVLNAILAAIERIENKSQIG
jgi:broad-specificity NMP kinase